MPDLDCKTCFCLEIPMLEYSAALALQHHLVSARQTGVIENDIVLILERPCVFTLGRRGGAENLKVSSAFLNRLKIPVIQVERGGDITFHGPGQLVVYPIFDLHKTGLKIIEYVSCIEEIMLRTFQIGDYLPKGIPSTGGFGSPIKNWEASASLLKEASLSTDWL